MIKAAVKDHPAQDGQQPEKFAVSGAGVIGDHKDHGKQPEVV